jgi:RNA polymerase sigma-70 factor (ECF subfamily)
MACLSKRDTNMDAHGLIAATGSASFMLAHQPARRAVVPLSSRRENNASVTTSDETLVAQVATGDKRALHTLYGRHSVRVYRYALRLLKDTESAEDVVSEVFIEVWRRAGRFENRSQVSTWLLGIARHKALSLLRSRVTEPLDEEVAEQIEDPSDDPEVTMQKEQRRTILQDCLTQLSVVHREIVDLVYYHGRSIEEAAAVIGVPLNTVKTRMFYARKRIAELLAAQGLARAHI